MASDANNSHKELPSFAEVSSQRARGEAGQLYAASGRRHWAASEKRDEANERALMMRSHRAPISLRVAIRDAFIDASRPALKAVWDHGSCRGWRGWQV